MKHVLIEIIRRYYSADLVTKSTQVITVDNKPFIRTSYERSAVLWQCRNQAQEFEDDLAKEIIDGVRARAADDVYGMVEGWLKATGKWEEATKDDIRTDIENQPCDVKMNWCVRVLAKFDILDMREVIPTEEVSDEDGSIIGMRQLKNDEGGSSG